jgi:DNA polymerase III subunit epsilon
MALPKSLSFVDIETTGLSASHNRIIELGIIRVDEDRVIKEFNSLINPETARIDPFIQDMTGITLEELERAPSFYELKDEISETLADSVFVAHNVRFDYGFIRNEFKRVGMRYSSKHFCSVKLARILYPTLPRYGLDKIIENFNIQIKNRHRAYDDARVVFDFYNLSKSSLNSNVFEDAVATVLKKTTLPVSISPETIDSLPDAPGVYIFYGDSGMPLYIGKSINIRERVISHFSNDLNSPTDMKLYQQAIDIESIETAGELGALLLESKLIKEKQPLFNRKLRDSRKMQILLKRTDMNGYSTVSFKELGNLESKEINNILGVFKSKKLLNEYVYGVAKEKQLCPKLLGMEKGKGSCFYFHLGTCKGACIGKEKSISYNMRFDEGFYSKKVKPWKFKGAIGIKELGEISEMHIVDNWCYLGSLKSEFENIKELNQNYIFDYDTYKILSKFILNPKNIRKIVNLKV